MINIENHQGCCNLDDLKYVFIKKNSDATTYAKLTTQSNTAYTTKQVRNIVLWTSDARMDITDDEEKSLDCCNSPYEIIMMRESGTEKIVGILKPDDTEIYKLNDEHELKYRQYFSVTSGYEHEMFMTMCEEKLNYYPYLSNSTIEVFKDG